MASKRSEIVKTLLRNGMVLVAEADTEAGPGGIKGIHFVLNTTPITAETATALLLIRASPGYQEPKP